jgi:hypothetical protein
MRWIVMMVSCVLGRAYRGPSPRERSRSELLDIVPPIALKRPGDESLDSIGSWPGTRAYGGRSVRPLFLHSSAARVRAA